MTSVDAVCRVTTMSPDRGREVEYRPVLHLNLLWHTAGDDSDGSQPECGSARCAQLPKFPPSLRFAMCRYP
eukprot:scaffold36540_cov162-Isochrysis_galbana.AAC.1